MSESFATKLTDWIFKYDVFASDVAEAICIAESTVEKWQTGKATPSGRNQQLVEKYFFRLEADCDLETAAFEENLEQCPVAIRSFEDAYQRAVEIGDTIILNNLDRFCEDLEIEKPYIIKEDTSWLNI